MIRQPKLNRGEYWNKTELKARGWTDGMLKRFLPQPDATRSNPRYQCAAPMCLYLRARVEQVEATKEYREQREATDNRRKAALAATRTKETQTRAYVDALQIAVPQLEQKDLVRRACASYNALQAEKGRDSYASPDSDPEFLDRICVNFLRHECTPYENHLAETFGKVGAREAYQRIKEKVLEAIGEAYPDLLDECDNQLDRMSQAQ